MDRTHYRFFDWKTAHDLITNAGYSVEVATADGVFPLARTLPGIGAGFSRVAVRLWPGRFAWQFVFRARPLTAFRESNLPEPASHSS
jgi:hypothetical protein